MREIFPHLRESHAWPNAAPSRNPNKTAINPLGMVQAISSSPMHRNLTANYGAASAAVCRAILLALTLNLAMHARSQVTGSEWRAPRGTLFECWSLAHTNWPGGPGPF